MSTYQSPNKGQPAKGATTGPSIWANNNTLTEEAYGICSMLNIDPTDLL